MKLQTNWYQELLRDLKELEFEGIVLTKHAIGKRILTDFEKFGSPEYGSKRVENIAKDLEISSREIYLCIQFAEKCDTVTQLEDRSWRWVTHNYLPEPKELQNRIVEERTPELPEGKYNVIYVDPPWKYNDECNDGAVQSGGAKKHYQLMTIEQLCNLNIPADNNSVMFMWTTSPLLEESFEVVNAWGFKYKSSFVWDKVKHNMGHYNSVRHEFLLICTKGSFTPENKKLFDSVYSEEKTKHSKKPDWFYEMIETLYPNGKYLELFARKKHNNKWTAWGNEI